MRNNSKTYLVTGDPGNLIVKCPFCSTENSIYEKTEMLICVFCNASFDGNYTAYKTSYIHLQKIKDKLEQFVRVLARQVDDKFSCYENITLIKATLGNFEEVHCDWTNNCSQDDPNVCQGLPPKKPKFNLDKWKIDLTEYKEQPRRYKCPECNETHDFGNISGWGDNFPSDYDWAKKRPNERTGIGCICSNCGTLSTSQFSMEAITEVLKQIFEDIVDDGAVGRYPFMDIKAMEV